VLTHAYLCCDNYLQTVSQKIELLVLGRSGQRKKHKGDGEFKHLDQMPLWQKILRSGYFGVDERLWH
jgi:hypothetical protein